MTTKEYFETELNVHFTCYELHEIAHALAELSINECSNESSTEANLTWKLRTKVIGFIDQYKNAVL